MSAATVLAVNCRSTVPPTPAPAQVQHAGALADLDTTCSPCRDFFQYATGGWLERTTIPAAYPAWSSFDELRDRNEAVLHRLLDRAAADTSAPAGSTTHKLGLFYATCMDSARADADGVRPLQPELNRIGSVASRADLVAEIARLHRATVPALFGLRADQDAKQSTQVIAVVSQGGLGLPDRDHYTKTDTASVRLRQAYVEHQARLLELLGEPAAVAQADARTVLTIETALATASMTRVELRDPNATYHKMTIAELEAIAPAFGWGDYLRATGPISIDALNVAQPRFFQEVNRLLTDVPLADWQAYLRTRLVSSAAPWLGSQFDAEAFRFRQVLVGVKEQLPRWKRCLQRADGSLGHALGQAYVEETFPPAAKARALAMVEHLKAVLRDRLTSLEWMSDSTRRQALAKLDAFQTKIGYPDVWRDYSGLAIEQGPFLDNLRRAAEFEHARRMATIGGPVDRTEWQMTPPTVNAYYTPTMNEIVFPAGILQPPFFDPDADDAVNYGSMGAVIGHEMTHGFDDRGRQYDADGNLRDWWTREDGERFQSRARLVERQFSGYFAVDSTRVNGKLTLGENIADLGGLMIAYAALEHSLAGKPVPPKIDGFTAEQRFFLAWARIWRSKRRPEYAHLLATTDAHAPGQWRANGPLADMPAFARAFGCKGGDPMVQPDSVRPQIW
jgi:putative endopeptidase